MKIIAGILIVMAMSGLYGHRNGSRGNGPELVDNGGFGSVDDWTKGVNWTINGGVATYTSPEWPFQNAEILYQDDKVVAGRTYKVTYTVESVGEENIGDNVAVYAIIGGQDGTRRTTEGTFTETIVAGSTNTRIQISGEGGQPGDTIAIDNVSVKELKKKMGSRFKGRFR